jgi:hypothetical protein
MICKYWINRFLDWALPSNPMAKYRIKCLCWQVDCLSLISLNPITACKLKKVLFVLFVCYGQHLRRNIHSKKHGHYHRCALAAIMAGSPIHVTMPRTRTWFNVCKLDQTPANFLGSNFDCLPPFLPTSGPHDSSFDVDLVLRQYT